MYILHIGRGQPILYSFRFGWIHAHSLMADDVAEEWDLGLHQAALSWFQLKIGLQDPLSYHLQTIQCRVEPGTVHDDIVQVN